MRFTKYNNPNKRRRHCRKSYTDRVIDKTTEMLTDKMLGYNAPLEVYTVEITEQNADSDWVEMLHNAKAVELVRTTDEDEEKNGIETFYTGGGIWLTACPLDAKHYYTIDNDFIGCLNLYEDRFEGWEHEEFPCERMIWSKSIEELSEEERSIYEAMRKDLEENAW